VNFSTGGDFPYQTRNRERLQSETLAPLRSLSGLLPFIRPFCRAQAPNVTSADIAIISDDGTRIEHSIREIARERGLVGSDCGVAVHRIARTVTHSPDYCRKNAHAL
jgi:hypothetical protein